MKTGKPIEITAEAALRLVELIQEQARLSDSELVKKILLRAGIKIADLALECEANSRRLNRAA